MEGKGRLEQTKLLNCWAYMRHRVCSKSENICIKEMRVKKKSKTCAENHQLGEDTMRSADKHEQIHSGAGRRKHSRNIIAYTT